VVKVNLSYFNLIYITITIISVSMMVYLINSLALFTISMMSYIAPCIQVNDILSKHKISYLSSTAHAIMVSLMSSLVVLGYRVHHSLYFYSIGYYMADLWYLIYINVCQKKSIFTDSPLIIHHLVMLLYEGYTIIYDSDNYQVFYFLNRVLLAEFSVVPLNALWYYRTIDNTNKTGLIISGVLLMITYFISRVVNLSILFVEVYYSPIRYMGICGFPVLIFNYMWFYKIVKGCFKQLKK
jgi:hypothetical protein